MNGPAARGSKVITYSLVFHAREDDVEHLRECGFGRGLVDEVAAGQVDVVAGSDGEQNGALVNLDVGRGHSRQQRLHRRAVSAAAGGLL